MCMSENKFCTYFSLNWQMRDTKFKTPLILVYEHVDIYYEHIKEPK